MNDGTKDDDQDEERIEGKNKNENFDFSSALPTLSLLLRSLTKKRTKSNASNVDEKRKKRNDRVIVW